MKRQSKRKSYFFVLITSFALLSLIYLVTYYQKRSSDQAIPNMTTEPYNFTETYSRYSDTEEELYNRAVTNLNETLKISFDLPDQLTLAAYNDYGVNVTYKSTPENLSYKKGFYIGTQATGYGPKTFDNWTFFENADFWFKYYFNSTSTGWGERKPVVKQSKVFYGGKTGIMYTIIFDSSETIRRIFLPLNRERILEITIEDKNSWEVADKVLKTLKFL